MANADDATLFGRYRQTFQTPGDLLKEFVVLGRHSGRPAGPHVHVDTDVLAGGGEHRLAALFLRLAEEAEEGVDQLVAEVEELVGDEKWAARMQLVLVRHMVFKCKSGPVVVVVVPESNTAQHVLGSLIESPPIVHDIHVSVPVGPVGGDDALVDAESPLGIENQIGRQAEGHGSPVDYVNGVVAFPGSGLTSHPR